MHNNITKKITLLPLALSVALLAACGGGDEPLYLDENNNVRKLSDVLEERAANNGEAVIIDDLPVLEDVTVSADGTTVVVPGRSMLETIAVDVATTSLGTPLPTGFSQVGNAVDVSVSDEDQALLNGPVSITLSYDGASVSDESHLMALYFDGTSYQPVTILGRDAEANTLTFDSRRFSTFVLVEADGSAPAVHDSGFLPSLHGWTIENFGTYFSPGGTSFGMAGYAAWHYENGATMLNSAYLEDTAQILAARVQIAQGETWGVQSWRKSQSFKDEDLWLILTSYISTFDQPVVITLGTDSPITAALAYGYDAGGLFFYDPNTPGTSQYLPFDGTSFGQYNGLTAVGYAALASYGTDADFATLSAEADNGFPGSENLAIDTPVEDEMIDGRETDLTGSFLNDLADATSLYVEVKGVGRQLSVSEATFSNVIEISSGINTIVALAGVDASTENNWFEDAPTVIRDVEGTLPPAQLLVTLTWEQNETDVDLYITEPEGETMWYGGRQTSNGLELDIDDTTGFGPEHGTLEVGGTDTALEGEYIVRVHYFSDDGLDVDATGRVTIVINEGAAEQSTLSLRFRIANDNSSESGPGETGSSWVDIAKVDVFNNTIDTDFSTDSPSQ